MEKWRKKLNINEILNEKLEKNKWNILEFLKRGKTTGYLLKIMSSSLQCINEKINLKLY